MTQLRVLKGVEFVKLNLSGDFDAGHTFHALKDILLHLKEDSTLDIFFDLRESNCNLTEKDVYEIADFILANESLFKGRVAMLIDSFQAIDNASFFRFCVHSPAIRVRIFFEEAQVQQWFKSPPTLV
ncbi:MAG: hypothetical protein HWE27_13935 [Gammaproteobacteria bacterium]|nr:hypothetical protein [Gammaproteobacteria bacterium]